MKIKASYQLSNNGDIYLISINGKSYKSSSPSSYYNDDYSNIRHRIDNDNVNSMKFVAQEISKIYEFSMDDFYVYEESEKLFDKYVELKYFVRAFFTDNKNGFTLEIDKLNIYEMHEKETFFNFIKLISKKLKTEIEKMKTNKYFEEREIEI